MKLGAKFDFITLATFNRLVLNKNHLFTPYRINYYSKYFMMKKDCQNFEKVHVFFKHLEKRFHVF